MPPPHVDEDPDAASETESPPSDGLREEQSVIGESEDDEIVAKGSDVVAKESDADGDEYIVEEILDHMPDEDGNWALLVKWQGYDKESDRTWEPEENLLEGASDVLSEYWTSIGGHPNKRIKKRKRLSAAAGQHKKRGRKSATESEAPTPDLPKATLHGSGRGRPARKSTKEETPEAEPKKWEPPTKKRSWEDDVMAVDTVEEARDSQGHKIRIAYLAWNNGEKSSHMLSEVNRRCPQKMLSYYEQHLVFKTGISTYDPYANGHDGEDSDRLERTEAWCKSIET